ncbi:MAG: DUF6261 family protein [Dysgonamonadaceae bacterium]|jgi:hypothetical protein|nr:DUF6261 family protein [Dysgonamonadaceae bacterium]
MKQIKAINFGKLKMIVHCSFLLSVSRNIESSSDGVKEILLNFTRLLNEKLEIEEKISDWQRSSSETYEIEKANKRLDKSVTALRLLIKAHRYNLDEQVIEAASRIYEMLVQYGNINSKPYMSQIGDTESILRQLEGLYSSDVEALFQYIPIIKEYIAELSAANTEMKDAIDRRGEYYKQKPQQTFREIRKEIEPIYREIIILIDAGVYLNLDPGFSELANRLNSLISSENRRYRRTRYSIKKTKIEYNTTEKYTGEPITPVPKIISNISRQANVRLELGKDFYLRYKDNKKVGNAKIIIYGKGNYKDKTFVTFYIQKPVIKSYFDIT